MTNASKSYTESARALREKFVAEEEEILNGIRAGDDSLRSRLVDGNLLLVMKIAHAFKNRGVPFWDLVSEGNCILVKASELWDPNRGAPFSSYVATAVRRRISLLLSTWNRIVRPSNSGGVHRAMRIRHWVNNYTVDNGDEPDIKMIMKEFPGFSEKQIRSYLLSLIDRVDGNDEWEVVNDVAVSVPEISNEFNRQELGTYLKELMKKRLDSRTIEIIEKRTGIATGRAMTLEEISCGYALTRERVRQIYAEGIKCLKEFIDPYILGHIQYRQQTEESIHGPFT